MKACSCTLAGTGPGGGCCQDRLPPGAQVIVDNTTHPGNSVRGVPPGAVNELCLPKPLTENDIRRIIREELKR